MGPGPRPSAGGRLRVGLGGRETLSPGGFFPGPTRCWGSRAGSWAGGGARAAGSRIRRRRAPRALSTGCGRPRPPDHSSRLGPRAWAALSSRVCVGSGGAAACHRRRGPRPLRGVRGPSGGLRDARGGAWKLTCNAVQLRGVSRVEALGGRNLWLGRGPPRAWNRGSTGELRVAGEEEAKFRQKTQTRQTPPLSVGWTGGA